MKLPILFEDNHLLVINKPAGWISQGALPGQASVVDEAAAYLKSKYQKPGNVFVGIVSRLDSPLPVFSHWPGLRNAQRDFRSSSAIAPLKRSIGSS